MKYGLQGLEHRAVHQAGAQREASNASNVLPGSCNARKGWQLCDTSCTGHTCIAALKQSAQFSASSCVCNLLDYIHCQVHAVKMAPSALVGQCHELTGNCLECRGRTVSESGAACQRLPAWTAFQKLHTFRSVVCMRWGVLRNGIAGHALPS